MTTQALERILQSQGFGSRKECRSMVRAGRVLINGRSVAEPFEEVATEGLSISVDGKTWPWREQLYLAMHKPVDFECSHKPSHYKSVFSLLPAHFITRGVQCVGRLDADTSGLLLLSDDGQFVHSLSSPKRSVEKVYEIETAETLTDAQLAALNAPVVLREDPEPALGVARRTGEKSLELIIDEGRYHQVKRMLGAVGNRVARLHRTRVGQFLLPADLTRGGWVEVSPSMAQ